MGQRGRKPRPAVFNPPPTHLQPAEWLNDLGRKKFFDLLERLSTIPGMIEECDDEALNLTALAYQDLHDATEILKSQGLIFATNDGKTEAQHPANKLKQDAIRRIMEGLDRFGLNPRSRKRMGSAQPKVKDEDDGFAAFVG